MNAAITAELIADVAATARDTMQALAGHGPGSDITADIAACVRIDAMTDETLVGILGNLADVASTLHRHEGQIAPSPLIIDMRERYPRRCAEIARAAIDIASDVQYSLERANGLLRGPASKLTIVPSGRATLTDGQDWACTDLQGTERLAHLRALQTAAFKVHDALSL